ncbi:MAG: DUF1684 domain-containing protein [Terriglobia bacterium]
MPAALRIAALLLAGSSFVQDEDKFRAGYEADLRAPDGWLSVSDLIWLKDGATKVPGGSVKVRSGKVVYQPATGAAVELKSDKPPGSPNVVDAAGVKMTLIDRQGKLGIRVKDPDAETRRNFPGCKWFPIRQAWDIKARWVAYPKPRQIPILNVLGQTGPEPSPGYAEFSLAGKSLRLEPITEDDHLFFIFKDKTADESTYPAGRFLYAALPRNGVVDLDFNQAENPPCAFTAYATCPLPPKQNVLPVAIEAGEKRFH